MVNCTPVSPRLISSTDKPIAPPLSRGEAFFPHLWPRREPSPARLSWIASARPNPDNSPYRIHHDWSHLGFDRYREGSAILTRHELLGTDSGYVSTDQDPRSIGSRRVVLARVAVPYIGPVDIFSCHLSWIDCGFREQFPRLRQWACERQAGGAAATLLCGDFNIPAGREGEVYEGGRCLAEVGCDSFYTWSYRGGLGTNEASDDPARVWAEVERLYRELAGRG